MVSGQFSFHSPIWVSVESTHPASVTATAYKEMEAVKEAIAINIVTFSSIPSDGGDLS